MRLAVLYTGVCLILALTIGIVGALASCVAIACRHEQKRRERKQ